MTKIKRERIAQYISLGLLSLTSITLIGMQQKPLGWGLFIATALSLLACSEQLKKDFSLILIPVAILGITPIDTTLTNEHIAIMGAALIGAVGLPYLISRYVYKDYAVRFKFHHGRSWYKTEIFYIFFAGLVAYLYLPFYLNNTGSYLNWHVGSTPFDLFQFFLGTNIVGIWDELMFISTVLGLLRRHLPFWSANFIQAILFSSFLYDLGFRGWGIVVNFLFALLQGHIFRKTDSLFYVLTIHLTIDFVLFLALINANHPSWLQIFITH